MLMNLHQSDEFSIAWEIFVIALIFFLTLVNKLFSLNFSFSFSWAWLRSASFYLFLRLTSLQILLILFPIFIHHFVLPLFKMNFNTNKCSSGHRKLHVCVVKILYVIAWNLLTFSLSLLQLPRTAELALWLKSAIVHFKILF